MQTKAEMWHGAPVDDARRERAWRSKMIGSSCLPCKKEMWYLSEARHDQGIKLHKKVCRGQDD